VEVRGELEVDGSPLSAATNDLSKGGCGLIVRRAIPEGGTLKLTLFLTQDGIEDPDEDPFETEAKVMWTAERDDGKIAAGVQFGPLGQDGETQLAHFLRAIS
jgi:c-di-GMP-binding flagellar brake protein YcgR